MLFLFLFFLLKIHAVELDTISGSQFLTDGDTLVSPTGIFKLGFFQPGSSENKYLGIWYNKIPVTTVVWVANRNQPLTTSNHVLKIGYPGVLVLYNNLTTIWSSNMTTTTSGNVTAELRDTGNLVLIDQNKKVVWQSFDYPTDTLLPGMKLGNDYSRGLVWNLTSWKSNQDPGLGQFSYVPNTHGYPESEIQQGAVVKFRGSPWKNQRFIGNAEFGKNIIITFSAVITEKVVSFGYNSDNTSFLPRLTMNSSGKLETLVWLEGAKKWLAAYTFPFDVCDAYGTCGSYGVCSIDVIQQSCSCLDEKRFVPRDKRSWDANDWSGGCIRRIPLDCKKGSDGFVKYSVSKLPETASSWFNMNTSLEGCKAKCLNNCTCIAYANPDATLQGCVLWFNDLIDIRLYSPSNINKATDIFIRMASSEIVDQSNSKKKGGTKIKIILIVTIPLFLLIV
ncbi:hypothetical protein QVD17_06270 [Tagetes erecta]|uniref:Uncharacterized protein n=1 Tax=Tagetes erecta TaxID=13708 RepID=A0AAD8LFQ5_TARER|nr:hypothetical protein QVD17_06270 [Tagetes erecta]